MQQRAARSLFAALVITVIIFITSFAAFGQVQQASAGAGLPSTGAAPAAAPSAAPAPQPQADQSSPLQFKIGDATITPVAFMDLTNTFRSTNSKDGLATNFGSFPYSNSVPTGYITEDRFSVQNSRIGFRVDARVKGSNVMGYYEGDFVGGAGASSINPSLNTQVTSNSMLYRVRLYWVDIRQKHFEFLAGQSWSMMTPNRKQISPLPGDLFYGQEMDVNYIDGLTWGRIPGLRFLVHPSEKVTWGLSLENADQYFGGSGGAGNPSLPAAAFTAGQLAQIQAQVDGSFNPYTNSTGAGNGVNGLQAPQVHPDIISKFAFDLNSHVHFEFTGVESTARILNPVTLTTNSKAMGGGSFNGNFEVAKGLRLVTNNFWSDGEGRYIFGQAPNFIVRPDGTPSAIHSGSTIQGFEYINNNTTVYSYYGGIYIKPNTALDTNNHLIGWGNQPFNGGGAASNSQNRSIQEATIGVNQTLWRDAKYGALQLITQYAYFTRSPYFVAAGTPSNAHQSAAWFDIRYTLPGSAPTLLPPQ